MHCAEKGAWELSFRQKHWITAAASLGRTFVAYINRQAESSLNLIKHNQWAGYAFYW